MDYVCDLLPAAERSVSEHVVSMAMPEADEDNNGSLDQLPILPSPKPVQVLLQDILRPVMNAKKDGICSRVVGILIHAMPHFV